MDILLNRTQFICLVRPGRGLNPEPSALKSSALSIKLTGQPVDFRNNVHAENRGGGSGTFIIECNINIYIIFYTTHNIKFLHFRYYLMLCCTTIT